MVSQETHTLKILDLTSELNAMPSLKCRSQTSRRVVIAMNNKCAKIIAGVAVI